MSLALGGMVYNDPTGSLESRLARDFEKRQKAGSRRIARMYKDAQFRLNIKCSCTSTGSRKGMLGSWPISGMGRSG